MAGRPTGWRAPLVVLVGYRPAMSPLSRPARLASSAARRRRRRRSGSTGRRAGQSGMRPYRGPTAPDAAGRVPSGVIRILPDIRRCGAGDMYEGLTRNRSCHQRRVCSAKVASRRIPGSRRKTDICLHYLPFFVCRVRE